MSDEDIVEVPAAHYLLSHLLTAFGVNEQGELEWLFPEVASIRKLWGRDFEALASEYLGAYHKTIYLERNSTMSNTKELTAEELLSELLTGFFISGNGGLEWGYREGFTVREILSLDIEKQLLRYLRSNNNNE